MDSDELTGIFETAMREQGITGLAVRADFTREIELKVRWTRTISYIHFYISDMLKECQPLTLDCFANGLVRAILGDGNTEALDQAKRAIRNSSQIHDRFIRTYLDRMPGSTESGKGMFFDLDTILERVRSDYTFNVPDDVYIIWCSGKEFGNRVAHSSHTMRVIAINDRLDSPYNTTELLYAVVAAQMAFIEEPDEHKSKDAARAMFEKAGGSLVDLNEIGLNL